MQNEIYSKEYSTVNNAVIQLGDTDDSGKGRHFKSRFIQPGVAGYPGQFGNVLITKESLDKFIDTMVGVPVIVNHKSLDNNNVDDERVGVVNSVWYDDKDGWYWCDGIIWDSKAQKLITDKGWSVSCSYDVKTADDKGGTENNIKYDMEFLDGVFTHLALVNNPRYERANIVLNSKDTLTEQFADIFFEALAEVIVENSVNNERWITIKPHGDDSDDYRRLKLEDGESPKEAIDRVYKKENKKEEKQSKTESYKSQIDKKRKDLDEKLAEYQNINKKLDTYSEKLRDLIGDITDTDKINKIVDKFKKDNKEVEDLALRQQKSLAEYNKIEEEFTQFTKDISDEILKTDIENLSEEDLVDLQDAVKLTESFSVGYEQREKLTAFKRKIKDKIDSSNYNKNRQELTEVVGVKRGQAMDHTKADNGNVNPNYKPHSVYSENCQSCVVCYELRRRGFNVKTKPRVHFGYMQKLAEDCTLAYIDPKTGKQPSPQQLNVTTPDKAYEWLDKNVGDGRYEFRVVWKNIYKGHIITAYRENNKLVLYDPQTNKTYNTKEDMKIGILNNVRYRGKEITKPYILRVDNLDFNSKILDSIVEA